jgi:hypothetical protein
VGRPGHPLRHVPQEDDRPAGNREGELEEAEGSVASSYIGSPMDRGKCARDYR